MKNSTNNDYKFGFSLLEMSIVLGIIGLVVGMSMSVGNHQLEQQKVGSTWGELKVIKESLKQYGKRYSKLPCPAPINVAKTDSTYGLAAPDCDSTPTAGVTHYSSGSDPIVKVGGVPFRALGLSSAFAADEWGNRYIYTVDDNLITEITSSTTGDILIYDSGDNDITSEAAFTVFSAGKTGAGSTSDDSQTATACSATQRDNENCDADKYNFIDQPIKEAETAANYYDDLIVWSKVDNILANFATIDPTNTPVTGCVAGAGVLINGITAGDSAGLSVSSAGDVNGDGYDDVIISATGADPNGSKSGETYIVFGKASGWTTGLDLSTLDGTNGFVLNGVAAGDGAGSSVSAAGDVNGDGYGDVIIGATGADPNGSSSGASYVVFGKASGWAASLNLSTLDGTTGFVLNGVDAGDGAGKSVSYAGDVNGDGYDDVIIGAYAADPNGSNSGESYVVFGKASGWVASINLSSLDGTTGFVLNGSDASSWSGNSVSDAGDVNGDGYDDVIIGAYQAETSPGVYAGESYVVFGKASGWAASFELSSLDGSNGVKINGIAALDYSGMSVSSAGDVNGDGYDDVIIGATGADPNGSSSGATYVIFGKASAWAASFDLSSLSGSNGFILNGIDVNDQSGGFVSGAGDFNGDGYDDVIIRAIGGSTNGSYSGETYVLFGKAAGWAVSIEASALDGTNGVIFNGIDANDFSSVSVDSAGDINNDGYDDVIIGAYGADPNGTGSGESYVVFGNSDWSSTSGTVELSALTTPEECVSNACTITVEVDLDGAASETSWSVSDFNTNKKLMVGSYTAADNNTIDTRTYALPRGSLKYNIVLDDSGNDGFAGPSDKFSLKDTVPTTKVLRDNSAAFTSCNKEMLTDVSCGIDNNATTDMTCTTGSCSAGAGVIMNGNNNGPNNTLSGTSISSAGDVNGDGYDDIIIGAPLGHEEGFSYVVFGQSTGWTSSLEILARDGTNGFIIAGVANYDHSGTSVSGAGDVNGDGYDDILVGAPDADPGGSESGEAYIIFGKAAGWTTTFNLSSLNGTNGMTMAGRNAGDHLGQSVSGAGDINGDGYDDIIIGAYRGDPNGTDSGETYVVFGKAAGWAASINLSSLDGTTGFVINGIDASDFSGVSVSSAGDINNDGYDDIVIGARYADPNGASSGESYVIFGKASGWVATFELSKLDGTTGFIINGIDASDSSGESVSSAGDVNGDGYDDILIGASLAGSVTNAGQAYIIFGKSSGWTASFELSSLNGTNGVILDAIYRTGNSVSSAGDVNNDGYDDVIIGVYQAAPNGSQSGASYVLFGKSSGWSSPIDLTSLSGSDGFVLNGIDLNDNTGHAVSAAGDVNGDGYGDVITSAPYADPNGNSSGETYLVFGNADWSSTSGTVELSALTDPAPCTGCAPACNSGCNGTTLELKACQSGTCNTLSSTASAPQCAAPTSSVACDVTCNGTIYPTPGDVCTDGSVYAGVSPDGDVCMYTTPADAGTAKWAVASGATGVTSNVTGENNTATLDLLVPSYPAANNCAALSAHSNTDWYLPSLAELKIMYTSEADIGGFTSDTLSSTEVDDNNAVSIDFSSGQDGLVLKTSTTQYRCVRKDTDTTAVTCDLVCGGTNTPNPGDVCTDGSIFVGINKDCGKCMYTKTIEAGTYKWAATDYSTTITDAISGWRNTINLDRDPASMPAGDLCYAQTAYGKTDWYLPSYDELYLLYSNQVAIGGWTSGYYWSSTEYDASQTYAAAFGVADASLKSKTTAYYVRCVRMDGSYCTRTSACAQACGGTITPNPGDTCADGSMYLGVSPDNNSCMYAPNAAAASRQFLSSMIASETATSSTAGAANTAALVADGHVHPVASNCNSITNHSQSDWYSPSMAELVVAADAYTALTPLIEAVSAWSSTCDIAGNGWIVDLSTGTASQTTTNNSYTGLCVRTDINSAPDAVACALTCNGTTTPTAGDVCTDGSVYAGISPDGNKCMYIPSVGPTIAKWAVSTGTNTGATSSVTGYANTVLLSGLGVAHPAATQCLSLSSDGKSDWYLPAYDELVEVLTNGGSLHVTTRNWSSTENNSNMADTVNSDGTSGGAYIKTANNTVYCVRKDP